MSTIATTQSVGDKRRAVYWIGGSKGGVGKSMVTFATLDYLLERAASVCLVEAIRQPGRLESLQGPRSCEAHQSRRE